MRSRFRTTKAVCKAIQEELKDRDYRVEKLQKTVKSLPQKPLGADGTTFAELPSGTNAVTLPSGEVRLALPVSIADRGTITISAQPPTLSVVKPEDRS